jgi:hypothetical protein
MQPVSDDEILYRRVLADRDHIKVDPNVPAGHRVSVSAFDDTEQQPSVDLASECVNLGGPPWTQEGDEHGVVSVIAHEVRSETIVGFMPAPVDRPPNSPKQVAFKHAVDVHRDPTKGDAQLGIRANPAHAEIRPDPAWCHKNIYRKLKEALSGKAKIILLPRPFRKLP